VTTHGAIRGTSVIIIMSGRGGWFGIFLLLSAVGTTGQLADGAADVSRRGRWGIEVLTFESAEPTVLWAGLVNHSKEARLACISLRGVSYEEKHGSGRTHGQGGSPHACVASDQFQLVRAGQTLFVRVTVPADLATRISGNIRVQLNGVERPVLDMAVPSESFEATWEGTMKEAADHGRALATKGQ